MKPKIGLVGVGRLGELVAQGLREDNSILLFDRNSERLQAVAQRLQVPAGEDWNCLREMEIIILAVPDQDVLLAIDGLNHLGQAFSVFCLATNMDQEVLESAAVPPLRCLSVKFVTQAGEMAQGQRPLIGIHHAPEDLARLGEKIFSPLGQILTGKAEEFRLANTLAAEAALRAAVTVEEGLKERGVVNPQLIQAAIGQVAAGTLKAYVKDELGPFARGLVREMKNHKHMEER